MKNLETSDMKRTALFVMELDHTSVEYANVPLTSLEESVTQGRMVRKLYLVITVNVITSPATDTMVSSAPGLTMESVFAGNAIVMKSGM